MSKRTEPTVRARVVRAETFTVPAGATVSEEIIGGTVRVALYEDDRASLGAESDYQETTVRWVRGEAFRADRRLFQASGRRYSGRNLELAEQHFREMVEGLRRQGCEPVQQALFTDEAGRVAP